MLDTAIRGESDSRVQGHTGGPPPVAAAAIAMLDQCAAFVCAAGAAYADESRILKGGTIGKHVRHTLDHFRAALEGAAAGVVVDYDHRERDVPMETEQAAALEAIAMLRRRLARVVDTELDRPLRVRVLLTADGQEAELRSTLGRELAFATHHAVHHCAMLGAIAAEFAVPTEDGFGKAPSTLKHERNVR
jgi:uncharacterized damage-inducible protein DinB